MSPNRCAYDTHGCVSGGSGKGVKHLPLELEYRCLCEQAIMLTRIYTVLYFQTVMNTLIVCSNKKCIMFIIVR